METQFYLEFDSGDIGYGQAPAGTSCGYFNSEGELLKALEGGDFSKQRCADVWNGFAGSPGFDDCKPVKGGTKAKSYMAAKIWAAIQRLIPKSGRTLADEVGELQSVPTPNIQNVDPFLLLREIGTGETLDAPTEPCDPKEMTKAKKLGLAAKVQGELAKEKPRKAGVKGAGSATKTPKAAKPKKDATERKARVKGASKKDQACRLMLRKSGATLDDFKAIGWNEGSVTLFSQWVALVVRNGITSFTIEKNGGGEKVYKAAA
jgi:hypothetical protein